jgi:hypothetical protein
MISVFTFQHPHLYLALNPTSRPSFIATIIIIIIKGRDKLSLEFQIFNFLVEFLTMHRAPDILPQALNRTATPWLIETLGVTFTKVPRHVPRPYPTSKDRRHSPS